MRAILERRLLQATVGVGALVPISGGIWGALGGVSVHGVQADSHARYLSGLLLGVGLGFWSCVPRIERRGAVFRTLAAVVFLGGLARLSATPVTGFPPEVSLPLVMELGVTPLLALWRERLGRRLSSGSTS